MKKRNNSKVFNSIKALTVSAMLTAMSFIIGTLCKTYLNFGKGLLRISFENLPIILSGIMYGPIVGGIVGAASDIVSYLFSPQVFPLNPVVTFGAISIGILSGAMAKYVVKTRGVKQVIVSGSVAHIVGSMIIKPIGLYQFYHLGVLLRIPLYLLIAPIEILILCLLFKNAAFRRLLNDKELS